LVICILGDLSFGYALYKKISYLPYFQSQLDQVLGALGQAGHDVSRLPQNFVVELYQVMKRTFLSALFIGYIAHALVYWGFMRQKPSAVLYLKMMSWFGPIFCFLFAWNNTDHHFLFGFFYLLMLAYLWLAFGWKYFDLKKKN
jgi:hypothetical protein